MTEPSATKREACLYRANMYSSQMLDAKNENYIKLTLKMKTFLKK